MADISILAPTDPVAIDHARIGLVYASDAPGRDHLVERIETGIHTIESAAAPGYCEREYEPIEVDRYERGCYRQSLFHMDA